MRFLFCFFIAVFFFCSACTSGGSNLDNNNSNQPEDFENSDSTDSTDQSDISDDITEISLSDLSFNQTQPLFISTDSFFSLTLKATLSDGRVFDDITSQLSIPDENIFEEVVWVSDNPEVARVSDEGIIQTFKSGSATLFAQLLNLQISFSVVVENKEEIQLTHLSFWEHQIDVGRIGALALELNGRFSNGETFFNQLADNLNLPCDLTFESSHPHIVRVGDSGIASPQANGVANIMVGCGDLNDYLVIHVSGFPITPETTPDVLLDIQIVSLDEEVLEGESQTLKADVTFDTGISYGVSDTFVTPGGNLATLEWKAYPSELVDINQAHAEFLNYGEVGIRVILENLKDTKFISIKKQKEEAINNSDYFLSDNDVFNLDLGTNGGFGFSLFPEIVFGLPWTGGTDVISFGGSGSLLIELKNYTIVDGAGIDFTIFENPVVTQGFKLFAERAQISVSDDGQNFYTFECDVNDIENQIYQGCAGVNIVNALENPLDPSVSGGDQFDLADVGLENAKYILIEDLNTCKSGDPTYPLCATASTQGFDLDAMAIINGVNE